MSRLTGIENPDPGVRLHCLPEATTKLAYCPRCRVVASGNLDVRATGTLQGPIAQSADALSGEHAELDGFSIGTSPEELLALHEALEEFVLHDPVKARLVELRFFAGLTLEQAAECLGISLSTADRGWRYARAWLYAAMSGDHSEEK